MREKLIEKKLCESVKKMGGLAVKFVPTFFAGFPDRIVLMPGGKISFAEIKTTGKDLSKIQKIIVPMLRRLGFYVVVIDNQIDLDIYLQNLKNEIYEN